MVAFYKHDIADWMDGTESLSHEAYRAYHVVCQLIYLAEGPITLNERGIAGRCNMSLRLFRRALDELLMIGKLTLENSKLSNERARSELESVDHNRENAGKGGKASGKSRRNKAKAEAPLPEQRSLIDKTRQDETISASPRFILKTVLDDERADAVIEHRKKKRAPLTERAARLIVAEFKKCPDPNAAADLMIARGWQGFEAEWMDGKARDGPGVQRNGTGYHLTHGTEEYTAWRKHAHAVKDGDLIYELKDKPGHVAHVPSRWPPRAG